MRKIFIVAILLLVFNNSKAQLSVNITNVVQPCLNNGSATAVVTGGQAPYTYMWTRYQYYPSPFYDTISTSNSLSNATAGYYFVTVKDANSQTAKDSVYMPGAVYFLHDTLPSSMLPEKKIVIWANCPVYTANWNAQINGSAPPYTYFISSVGTQTSNATSVNFSNISIGSYTAIVSDNNGCQDTVPLLVLSSSGYIVQTSNTPDTCTSNGTSTAIPVGGTPPYTYLWNTSPPQTTQTAVGLPSVYNSSVYINVIVTDANGCVETGYSYVQDSVTVHSIQSTSTINDATCGQSNGSITLSNTGGMPPYTYQWSNGATTNTITNLLPGTYTVTISDAAGCHEKFVKQVSSYSTIYPALSVTDANCNNTGGSITVSPSGGTSPYTYHWSNGQTGSTINNVGAGFYSVGITDANGCYGWAGDSVHNPNNCVAKISGRVYNDMNGNCVFDGNESGLPQQIIQLSNGNLYYSDWNGKYYFPPVLNPSGTYTISQTTLPDWVQACPSSPMTLTPLAGNVYTNNDFYDKPTPLDNNLEIRMYSDSCRPGFTFNQWVSVYNKGTSTMTGYATLQHDGLLNVMSTGSASGYNPSTHTFTFSFNNLAPTTWASFFVQLQAPSSATLFTPLTSYAVANPVSGDANPNDNYDTLFYRVTGSYDPNEKSVEPKGTGTTGDITNADSILHYTIHFQNTGSFSTSYVNIIDTIDNNLDIMSLKLTGSFTGGMTNYPPTVTFLSQNVVQFTFNYCYLQPASWNTANSSGFVSYIIKQRKNLSPGTQIKNRADIYFDYNSAILTNTTLNTITSPLGIENHGHTERINIYPNPNNGRFYLSGFGINQKETSIEVSDIAGRQVYKQQNNIQSDAIELNLLLNNGVYFVKVMNASGETEIQKVIISH